MDNVLIRWRLREVGLSRQMLAQDFCYGFAVASRNGRYTIIRHLRRYTLAEALHMNPVAMLYQSKQLMLLLRAYHIGD